MEKSYRACNRPRALRDHVISIWDYNPENRVRVHGIVIKIWNFDFQNLYCLPESGSIVAGYVTRIHFLAMYKISLKTSFFPAQTTRRYWYCSRRFASSKSICVIQHGRRKQNVFRSCLTLFSPAKTCHLKYKIAPSPVFLMFESKNLPLNAIL